MSLLKSVDDKLSVDTIISDTISKFKNNTATGIKLFSEVAEKAVKNVETITKCTVEDNTSQPSYAARIVISPYLSKLYNICIASGIFPNILKTSKITPIYKKSNNNNNNNKIR